ncbi:MAG: hypothetical protein WCI04_01300 [archaeon]
MAVESFNDYVCLIDDLLDKIDSPNITKSTREYKQHPKARENVSLFVRHVKRMQLTTLEKK